MVRFLKNTNIKISGSAVVHAVIGCVFAAMLVAFVWVHEASALRVSMKRIIFEGKERSQVVTIINNSNEEQTYRLGWRNFRMTEDKILEDVEEGQTGDLKLAEPYLRYAPRRVTVPAGETQQVRIMARLPDDMQDGEYRSHLYIAPEAKPPKFSAEEENAAKTKPVIKITMLTGLSLPVFIRKGQLSAKASFSDARLTDAGAEGMNLSLVLNREGNRSLYGDFDFICLGAKEVVAKQTMGIAVYPEVSRRKLNFKIPYPEGGAAACPQMKVVYTADAVDPQYKGGVMAETTVALSK